jgi:predicted outer membrane repeat protein
MYNIAGSTPTLTNCTVAGNSAGNGGGIYCGEDSSPVLTSCIVWSNVGGSFYLSGSSNPQISYSCIEGEDVWPGIGNINADPLLCSGWETVELMVNNQQEFEGAFSFHVDFALSGYSPCIGTGKDGVDMGADKGVCDDPLPSQLLIHLAPGAYNISGLSLVHNVSIEGAGEEETIIKGTVRGLRTGARLSHVTVQGEGTGIHVEGGEAPEILNCTITTGNSGPGVSCRASSPVLTNCTITGNSAPGGGLRCHDSSAPVLTNCTITENPGGGVNCLGSSPVLTNCMVTGNSAHDGAGVSCYDSSSPVLINCTITGNSARSRWGGGFDCSNSSPVLTGCIVWGNVGGSIDLSGSSNPQISFSCIEGGFPGEGNIDSDPLFIDLGYWHDNNTPDVPGDDYWVDGDYHLKSQAGRFDQTTQAWVKDDATSPCIDAGDPLSPVMYEPHPRGCIINMGAYGGTVEASKSPLGCLYELDGK